MTSFSCIHYCQCQVSGELENEHSKFMCAFLSTGCYSRQASPSISLSEENLLQPNSNRYQQIPHVTVLLSTSGKFSLDRTSMHRPPKRDENCQKPKPRLYSTSTSLARVLCFFCPVLEVRSRLVPRLHICHLATMSATTPGKERSRNLWHKTSNIAYRENVLPRGGTVKTVSNRCCHMMCGAWNFGI